MAVQDKTRLRLETLPVESIKLFRLALTEAILADLDLTRVHLPFILFSSRLLSEWSWVRNGMARLS